MSKFNVAGTKPRVTSPIQTERTPSGLTHEGAPGYVRNAQGELFLLAVSNMVGEATFYEKAGDRDERYERLIRQVAIEDPQWTADFLAWLRGEGNMRSASLVGACEAVKARLDAPPEQIGPGDAVKRRMISSVLQRADEPGELLAYWVSHYGRAIPKPVKRGVADAVARLYNERSLLKYDTASHGYRFADVLDLVHASPHPDKRFWQGDLFAYALDRRHGRDDVVPESLRTVAHRAELMAMPAAERRAHLDALVPRGHRGRRPRPRRHDVGVPRRLARWPDGRLGVVGDDPDDGDHGTQPEHQELRRGRRDR